MKLNTYIFTAIFATIGIITQAQTLYVPSGTAGITSSTPPATGVGIGTSSPLGTLHLNSTTLSSSLILSGNSTNQGGATTPAVKIINSDAQIGNYSQIEFFTKLYPGIITPTWSRMLYMNSLGAYFDVPIVANSTFSTNGNATIGTSSANKILTVNGNLINTGNASIGTTAAPATLTINGTLVNTGNNTLGTLTVNSTLTNIGDVTIATPTAKKTLTVNGSIVSNNNTLFNLNTATLAGASQCWGAQPLMIRGASGTDQQIFYIGQINDASNSYTYLQSQMNSNGAQKPIYLNPLGGAVAVGTINTQGFAFAVNGGILAEEVKVITDVPQSDYVFEPDYKLKSLGEVQKYVQTNKHLPEVPSAAEFKRDGYKVGQMDDLLLRKVEELTLYVIELQKQIEELKTIKQ
jgi:hypothetical protein